MANFRTHLTFAALASTAAASWLAGQHRVTIAEASALALSGTLGGLLPDLDADNSVPTRWLWNSAATSGALAAMFLGNQWFPTSSVLLSGLLVFIGVRWVIAGIAMRLTTHRGLFHSIPAGLCCGGLTLWLLGGPLARPNEIAFLVGAFVFGGFLLHLILDELYSVDLANVRIKRSFGTALKFVETENLLGTLAIYAALSGVFWLCWRDIQWNSRSLAAWIG